MGDLIVKITIYGGISRRRAGTDAVPAMEQALTSSLKYLRKRRIAWVSLIAVMLCTTMVLVVISVMGGWLRMFKRVVPRAQRAT